MFFIFCEGAIKMNDLACERHCLYSLRSDEHSWLILSIRNINTLACEAHSLYSVYSDKKCYCLIFFRA